MGYIRHNAIAVTGGGYPKADAAFAFVHEKAQEIFEDMVSPVIESKINGYKSFFVAPDGSKEGWGMSEHFDEKRKALCDFIDSLAYEDGSNSIRYVDIAYDENLKNEIERSNPGEG